MRIVLAVIVGAILGCTAMAAGPAKAQNLNLKFGPSWTCSNIDPNQTTLYDACKVCEARADDFFQDSDTAGHCVQADADELRNRLRETRPDSAAPPAAPPPAAAAPAPAAAAEPAPRRKWGALAGAVWKVHGVVQVAVGSAIKYDSEDEARDNALSECRKAGGHGCEIATTWNTGCGYITTGRNKRGAGWNNSSTIDKTLDHCRSKGYTCKAPIGGCVD